MYDRNYSNSSEWIDYFENGEASSSLDNASIIPCSAGWKYQLMDLEKHISIVSEV